jgi:membrane-associated protease RseP (regulator of RpoE activity)
MKRTIRIIVAAALAVAPLMLHADDRKPEEKRAVHRTVVVKDGKVYRSDGSAASVWSARRGYLGVQMLELTPELREHFRVQKDAGVLVSKVVADGPAAKAGLRAGDIITGLNGTPVDSSGDVARAVRERKNGEALRIDYTRDGVPASAMATVQEQWRKEVDLRDLDIQIPEIGKNLQEYFNGPEWKAKMERLQQLPDCGAMQQRMRELETKMKDLERRLKDK